jgi:hypothetical protein
MDPAILADRTDNNRTRGAPVTETHATPPVFPPGRYGRRRAGRRQAWLMPAMVVLATLVGLAFAARLYQLYGDPTFDAQVIRYTDITETQVVVDFKVSVPPGGSARCLLRARSYDHVEVGRLEVTVTAESGRREAVARHTIPTTARPFVGEVVRCRAAD